MTDTLEKEKNKRRTAILGLGVLLLVLIGVFYAGANIITKPLAEAKLAQLAAQVEAKAKAQGYQGSFTYKDISIRGFLFEKRAIVTEPTIIYSQRTAFGDSSVTITTDRVELVTDSMSLANYHVVFPSPLKISRSAMQPVEISFAQPPHMVVSSIPIDGQPGSVYRLDVAPPMRVVPTNGAPQANQAPATPLIVGFDANPKLITSVITATGASATEVDIRNLHFSQAGDAGELSIGGLMANGKYLPSGDDKVAFETALHLSDIGIKSKDSDVGPFGFKLNLQGTSQTPVADSASAGSMPLEYDVKINELAFQADTFNVTSQGDISLHADDHVPYGTLNVTIDKFSSLKNSKLIANEIKALLGQVFDRVNGAPTSDLASLNFTVKREKRGTLAIGQASLEELATMALSLLVAPMPPAALPPSAPEVTPSPVPEAAPVPLPDAGTTLPPATPDAPPAPALPAEPAVPGKETPPLESAPPSSPSTL